MTVSFSNHDRMPINLEGVDPRTPVYRIFKKDFFLDAVRSGHNVLVPVGWWQDPFENFFLNRTYINIRSTGERVSLSNLADRWYGQCWSFHEESDAMWRIYSHNASDEAVKVRSTVESLLQGLKNFKHSNPHLHAFVGKVNYPTVQEIQDRMNGASFMRDGASGGQDDGFAKWLCMKRDSFQHEAEIRLLACDNEPRLAKNGIIAYPLDANALFDEVVLDPRLDDATFAAAKAEIESSGWRHNVRQSDLYRVPLFELQE